MPSVSVIIPTFRHRDFVLTSLESVFAQTFTDYEVIVVNDGSPDDTGELLKPLVASGKIRYIEQANQGQAAARNRGLAEAKGKFIAFLDDDDLWPKDKLSWQLEELLKDPTTGVVAGIAEVIDESEKPLGMSQQRFGNLQLTELFHGNPIMSPGQTLIRADLLRDIGGLNNRIWGCDDWDLWFRASAKAKLVMCDRVGLRYRLHAGNAGNNAARMLQNSILVVETHLRQLTTRDRRRCRRVGWNIIAGNFGRPLVKLLKQRMLNGDGAGAFAALREFSVFVRPALRDPRIIAGFVIELAPRRAREMFTRLFRTTGETRSQVAGWVSSRVPPNTAS